MNENSKVGDSALQSGKTLTSLMGNTAIPSSLGTTVTGAIKNLESNGGIAVEKLTNAVAINSASMSSVSLSKAMSNYKFLYIQLIFVDSNYMYGNNLILVDILKSSQGNNDGMVVWSWPTQISFWLRGAYIDDIHIGLRKSSTQQADTISVIIYGVK